jgi:hypothetical protein
MEQQSLQIAPNDVGIRDSFVRNPSLPVRISATQDESWVAMGLAYQLRRNTTQTMPGMRRERGEG